MTSQEESLPRPGPAARPGDEEMIRHLAAGHVEELSRFAAGDGGKTAWPSGRQRSPSEAASEDPDCPPIQDEDPPILPEDPPQSYPAMEGCAGPPDAAPAGNEVADAPCEPAGQASEEMVERILQAAERLGRMRRAKPASKSNRRRRPPRVPTARAELMRQVATVLAGAAGSAVLAWLLFR